MISFSLAFCSSLMILQGSQSSSFGIPCCIAKAINIHTLRLKRRWSDSDLMETASRLKYLVFVRVEGVGVDAFVLDDVEKRSAQISALTAAVPQTHAAVQQVLWTQRNQSAGSSLHLPLQSPDSTEGPAGAARALNTHTHTLHSCDHTHTLSLHTHTHLVLDGTDHPALHPVDSGRDVQVIM